MVVFQCKLAICLHLLWKTQRNPRVCSAEGVQPVRWQVLAAMALRIQKEEAAAQPYGITGSAWVPSVQQHVRISVVLIVSASAV